MFVPRMLVMYDGLKKLVKPKIVANCQVNHKARVKGVQFYNNETEHFQPFIDIKGRGYSVSLHNPHFFFDYDGIHITGTIHEHYDPAYGWASIHQEVILVPSMDFWDNHGGEARDKEANIEREKKKKKKKTS